MKLENQSLISLFAVPVCPPTKSGIWLLKLNEPYNQLFLNLKEVFFARKAFLFMTLLFPVLKCSSYFNICVHEKVLLFHEICI